MHTVLRENAPEGPHEDSCESAHGKFHSAHWHVGSSVSEVGVRLRRAPLTLPLREAPSLSLVVGVVAVPS